MKILFALTSSDSSTKISITLLLNALTNQNHHVEIFSSNNFYQSNDLKIDIKQIRFDWDIIIATNVDSIYNVEQKIDKIKGIPIVFWAIDNDEIEVVNHPNIHKVIREWENLDLLNWGICNEIVETIQMPIVVQQKTKNNSNKGNKKAKLFTVAKNNLNILRMIINAINVMPDLQLTIWGDRKNVRLLNEISNTNIIFIDDTNDIGEQFKSADIIMGEGNIVCEAMNYKKPIIIAGKHGFGGLVTYENYYALKKTGFSGRIGGTVGEVIPQEILLYEINSIKQNDNIERILDKNYELIKKNCDVEIIANKFERIFNDVIELDKKVNNDQSLLKLKPKTASNIKSYKIDNYEYQIVREPNKRILGNIDHDMNLLLSEFDGEKSIRSIINSQSDSSEENSQLFFDNIRQLWVNKKIVFD